jgi:UDPglucose 6-dehydrogenase
MKIGVIGLGYVGSAVAASYPKDKVLVNDPKYSKISTDIETIKKICSAIFICVPTPGDAKGQCDVGILESVLEDLKEFRGIVICKSTAPPAVYKKLEKQSKLKLAHVPEFLTQVRAKYDYVNPHKIVVGCKKKLRKQVTDVLLSSAINFDSVNIEYCSIDEASFFKYMANTALAIKVVVNNEFYDLAQALGIDWQNIVDIAKTDHRLGSTHWKVPGPDGDRGFGGACFPKDTAAFRSMGSTFKVDVSVLDAAIKKNKSLRKKN